MQRMRAVLVAASVGMLALALQSGLSIAQDPKIGSSLIGKLGVEAAREKDLHTCPQAAFSRYQHIVRRELAIPDDQIVICGLALGYADPDAVPNSLITERAPLEDFTTWFHE